MIRLEDSKEDVFVEIIDFGNVPGEELVTQNADGSYTVLINARSSYDRQKEAFEHAVRHIDNLDFEKQDVQQVEAVAHQIAEKQKDLYKPVKRNGIDIDQRIRRLRKKMKAVEKEIKKMEEAARIIEEEDPAFFDNMSGIWLEHQRGIY